MGARLLLVSLVVALAGCSCSDETGGGGSGAGASGGAGGSGASGGAGGAGGSSGSGGAGASGGAGGSGGSIPGLTALRIDPPSATLDEDGLPPGQSVAFRALGTFADGERDVTAEVAWSLEDPALGTVAAGTFTSADLAGRTQVTATSGSGSLALTARAELAVRLSATLPVPDAPPDAAARFPPDDAADVRDDPAGPRIVYPSDGTMFPRNLERVLHQWRADAQLDLFELRFDSELAHLRAYTASRSFLPDADAWRLLAGSHAGASTVLTVRGTSAAAPGTVYQSQPVTLHFSRSEVLGALYYWSTGAQGVLSARISSPAATKFYTDPASGDDTCVSCHTVSRDGRRLAVGYGGERLREVTIPDREVKIPADPRDDGPEYGWGTFNPGATRLLYASKGRLTLLDADTGESLGAVTLPASTFATHPDWAPDGSFVAVALVSDRAPGNKGVQGSSIARLPVNADGTFGEPVVLVPSAADDDTLYFPSTSPDSRWIAYVRGRGGSKDNESSELFLVRADGSAPPVELPRLNRRVRDEDGITGIGNSMPTWAPSTRAEVNWLAFSSLRDYGDVLTGVDRDQLWAAAIDLDVAGTGADPTYAGFWLPFQDLAEGNHRAFWALSAEDVCPSDVELCDGLDNDCDGIVDEECCTPADEQCGNGVDDDCDGFADEDCCASMVEQCGNGVDDDCDGQVDERCDCAPVEECTNGVDDDCDGLVDAGDEDCIEIQ